VAFGGVEIGMPYANREMPSESDSIRLLHEAMDRGINLFDTARSYGRSEYIMGKAFKYRRSQVVICTKAANILTENGVLLDLKEVDEIIDRSLEESLKALETDYIDIYMLHQANDKVLQNEVISDKFTNLRKNGKIRSIGISTYTFAETDLGIDQGIWDVIQLPFNLLNQQHSILFKKVQEANLGVMIRSVLFRGMLSGHTVALHPSLIEIENWVRKFEDMLRDEWTDLAALAIKFALSYDTVSSVLVGIDKMEYLHRAVKVANGQYLSAEFLKELETMAYPDPDFLNLHEWDKKGWLNERIRD